MHSKSCYVSVWWTCVLCACSNTIWGTHVQAPMAYPKGFEVFCKRSPTRPSNLCMKDRFSKPYRDALASAFFCAGLPTTYETSSRAPQARTRRDNFRESLMKRNGQLLKIASKWASKAPLVRPCMAGFSPKASFLEGLRFRLLEPQFGSENKPCSSIHSIGIRDSSQNHPVSSIFLLNLHDLITPGQIGHPLSR